MRRNILLPLIILSALVSAANCQTDAARAEKTKPCKFLSFAEAEKILGRPVELVTNSWTFMADITRFDCAYRAVEKDAGNGREINLYFLLEESPDETEAKRIYADIWQSNKNHRGIEILSGLGDEAYGHGDQANFYFVMARKGKFTIRLKINKTSETTSPDELKAFIRRVIADI